MALGASLFKSILKSKQWFQQWQANLQFVSVPARSIWFSEHRQKTSRGGLCSYICDMIDTQIFLVEWLEKKKVRIQQPAMLLQWHPLNRVYWHKLYICLDVQLSARKWLLWLIGIHCSCAIRQKQTEIIQGQKALHLTSIFRCKWWLNTKLMMSSSHISGYCFPVSAALDTLQSSHFDIFIFTF